MSRRTPPGGGQSRGRAYAEFVLDLMLAKLTGTGPAGPTNSVQTNGGGHFAGSANFTYVDATHSLAMGSGASSSAEGTVAMGDGANASFSGAIAMGPNAVSSVQNGIAMGSGAQCEGGQNACAVGLGADAIGVVSYVLGNQSTSKTSGCVALGEENIAGGTGGLGANAVSAGFDNTASGDFSSALGAANQATALNGQCVGVGATSYLTGMTACASGISDMNGALVVDMTALLNGAPGDLALQDGTTQVQLANSTMFLIEVWLMATKVDFSNAGAEIRQLLVTSNSPASVLDQQTIKTLNGGVAAVLSSLTISVTNLGVLTIAANPGANDVRVDARIRSLERFI